MMDFEQRRFADFLAAQDEELPQFASDRERIAAWIVDSSDDDDEREEADDDVSVLDLEEYEEEEDTDAVCLWSKIQGVLVGLSFSIQKDPMI